MPTARAGLSAGVIGGKLYTIGGSAGINNYLPADEEYDPVSNTWSAKAVMHTARYLLSAGAIGGKLYAVGGVNGSFINTNEEYDPGVASSFEALTPNTEYFFKAKARNAIGAETGEGPVVSTYTLAAPLAAAGVFKVYTTSVSVNWTALGGTNGYTVRASSGSGGTALSSSTSDGNAGSLLLSEMSGNTTYYFQVGTLNGNGVANYINAGATVTLANTPTALPAAAVTYNSITAAWSANGNAGDTPYTAEISTNAGHSPVLASLLTVNTSIMFTGLPAANTSYYLRVNALNRAGSPTDWVSLGSTMTLVETPTSVYFDEISSNSITASGYAATPAFTGLETGLSGVAVALDNVYKPWRNGNKWTTKTPMPTARYGMAVGAISGKLYVVGGYNGINFFNTNEEYDPATNTWATKAAMPTARGSWAAGVISNKLYVVGGAGGNENENEEYDPVGNTWSIKAVMPTARYDLSGGIINGKLYAVGGHQGSYLNINEEYDPLANTWATKAVMPSARAGCTAGVIGGKLYIVGGNNGVDVFNTNEEYSPVSDTWVNKAAMPTARYDLSAGAIGGKLYVVGGYNGSSSLDPNEEYDPAVNTWTTKAPMPTARYGLAAGVVGGKLYAISGFVTNINEEYDPGVASLFTSLLPNTQYFFKAKTRNQLGVEGPESAIVSTYTLAAVSLPVSGAVFAEVYSSTLTVNWSSGTAAGGFNGPGASYKIQMSSAADFIPIILASTTYNLTLTTYGLSPNTTYWFKAQALNSNGAGSIELVLGSTVTLPVPPILTGYTLWASSATVAWGANGNAAGTRYQCDFSTDSAFAPVAVSYSTGSLQLTIDDLVPNTTYYLRLRALSADTRHSGYAQGLRLGLAAAPTWLAAFTLGPNNAGLYWDTAGNSGGLAAGSWTGAGTLPAARHGHAAAVSGDTLIISGGGDGFVYQSDVWSAPLSVNGQVGAWTEGRPLPAVRYGHTSAALKGRVYVIGGYDGTASKADVWSAPISSRGAAGAWIAETSLPQAVYAHASAMYNNRLYVLGGYGAGARAEVWQTLVKDDGTLGGWTAATPLPEARYSHAAALSLSTSAARLYVTGGNDSASSARAETWTAEINGDGSLSAWLPVTPLPAPLVAHGMAATPRALFVSGGNNGSAARSAALRATVNSDGTLGPWETQPSLPQAVQSHALLERGGRLLALGGYDGSFSKQEMLLSLITGTEYTVSVAGASFSSTPWQSAGRLEIGGLKPNTYHTFTAAARNFAGVLTGYSPALSTYTYSAQPGAAAFSNVRISSMQVNWLLNDNPAGTVYTAELSSDAAHTLLAYTQSVTVSSAVFTGLMDKYTFYARTRAVNRAGVYTAWTELGPVITRSDPTLDFTPPTMTNNQTGDKTWRRANNGAYNIGFMDTGGAYLDRFQIKASTKSGGAGPFSFDWSDMATDINDSFYPAGWSLTPEYWALLQPGTNYISVRVFDGNSNSSSTVDAFYILKDTTMPVITDNQAGETAWRMDDAGAVYDVDFHDALSGLAAIEYSASTTPASGSAATLGWRPISALAQGTSSYTANWGVDFAALANDATNYVSVRVWDLAGNTVTVSGLDVFKILKYVSGPEAAITQPAWPYQAVAGVITGNTSDARSHTLKGTELSFKDLSVERYWNGAAFLAPSPMWWPVSGGASWSFAPGIPWLEDLKYQVVARSSDVAGNYSLVYSTSEFTFDSLKPVLTSLLPADGGTIDSLHEFSGLASDASGLSGLALRLKRLSDEKWWDFYADTWTVAGSSAAVTAAAGWSYTPGELLKASLESQIGYFFTLYAADNSYPANVSQFGVYGSSFAFLDDTPPAAIADFTASSGSAPGNINLAWTAPGDDGPAGIILYGQYRVQHSTIAALVFSTADAQTAEDFTLVAAGSARFKELTSLLPGQLYYLRAWTRDDAGNWSGLSNGATVQATPYPEVISGHVMKVSSEGITGVLVEAFDTAGALQGSVFTLDDTSGTYVLSHLPLSGYKVQATWSAEDIISSVGTDGVTLGSKDVDFTLAINYELGSIGGQLTGYNVSSYKSQAASRGAKASAAGAAYVELYQRNRLIATAPVDATGKFLVKNLLPGKYTLKVPDANGGTKELAVTLKAGQALIISPLGELLKKDKIYAYPNPAGKTVIFHIESDQLALVKQVTVFDITGRTIKELNDADFGTGAGTWEAEWNIPSKVAPGVYIYAVRVKFEATGEYKKIIKKFAIIK